MACTQAMASAGDPAPWYLINDYQYGNVGLAPVTVTVAGTYTPVYTEFWPLSHAGLVPQAAAVPASADAEARKPNPEPSEPVGRRAMSLNGLPKL